MDPDFRLRSVRYLGDNGELIEGVHCPPRWRPRLTLCQSDEQGPLSKERVVVKYRRCTTSSAANISELVATLLLRRSGIKTVDPRLVQLSPDDSQVLRRAPGIGYAPYPGWHYGSVFDPRLQEVDKETWGCDLLMHSAEYVTLWVMDSLVMNHDRYASDGNARLAVPEVLNGKWRLVAVDQSDCFFGAGFLADGSFTQKCNQNAPVNWPSPVPGIIQQEGSRLIERSIKAAQGAVEHLDKIIRCVPDEWWPEAGVRREQLVECIRNRGRRLEEIVQFDMWKGLQGAINGGLNL